MALTTTQVTQLTDSVSQALSDFTTAFISNTGSNAPTSATIINGVSGTGTTATLGRIINFADLNSELALLTPGNKTAGLVSSYITSIRTISGFYQQFFPILDGLDALVGGLNTYLTANSIQVNAYFANAFNAYQSLAVALGYRTTASIPTVLGAANFFPSAVVDTMWGMTSSGATTFSSNAVGANASTAVAGGGTGQMYIYKNNVGNAAGGATFTITYTTATGGSTTATYTTVSGTPTASGSLASGAQSISGAIGSAITGVTGTGMTASEQYTIGIKLVRATAY